MSAQSLKRYLEELHNDLMRNKAGPYRQIVANKRNHRFRFSATNLQKQTLLEIKLRDANVPISSADETFILELAKTMEAAVETKLKQIAARSGEDSRLSKNQHGLSFRFTSNTDTGLVNEWTTPDDVFDKVRQAYSPALQVYFDNLQDYLKTQYFTNPETGRQKSKAIRTTSGKSVLQAKGKFNNAGHVGDQGVFESLMKDLSNNVIARGFHVVDDGGNKLSQNDLRKDLKKLGIDITLIRKSDTDEHIIVIEAATDNKKRGAQVRRDMLQQLENAIAKLEKSGKDLPNLKGSDSIVEKNRKKLINKTISPFSDIKGVSTKTEDLKDNSSSGSVSKKIKPGTSKTKKIQKNVSVKTKRVAGSRAVKAKTSMTHLIGIFNKELPRVVGDNMEPPRLEYQTGRFASSVQVTDITQTPKGFPSIGYTYQKRPYQTFEPGFRQGTPERDPRSLIDSSIREIAIKFALGRFYTRRL